MSDHPDETSEERDDRRERLKQQANDPLEPLHVRSDARVELRIMDLEDELDNAREDLRHYQWFEQESIRCMNVIRATPGWPANTYPSPQERVWVSAAQKVIEEQRVVASQLAAALEDLLTNHGCGDMDPTSIAYDNMVCEAKVAAATEALAAWRAAHPASDVQ